MTHTQCSAMLALRAMQVGKTRMQYQIAIWHMRQALRDANRTGEPRASLFRILNWLRADLRRIVG